MGRKGLSGRRTAWIAAASLTVVVISGCGSGSSSSSSAPGRGGHPADTAEPSTGVGMRAPISKVVVAQRSRPWRGRPRGSEAVGSKGCVKEEGSGEIGIYTDTPEPSCVQVTSRESVLIVNRTSAYHRSEGKSIEVGLGPYRARLLPQQAARFGPVGHFLGRGLHTAFDDRGRLGVLIEPADCGIFRASPGESLCFRRERASRLRRWHVAVAREHAPACSGSDLVVSVDRHTETAAGTVYSKLDVVDRSRRSCNVAGVPRVTAVDGAGKVVATARAIPLLRPRSRPDHRRTWLRGGGGGGVSFTVTDADGSSSGRCRLVRSSGLRVTMPGTADTQFVPLPMSYCPPPRGALALRVGRTE
jgi:Protein of unknown function (DUF4232)